MSSDDALAAARWRTQRVVNTELLGLYRRLGDTILDRQQTEGSGTWVIDRLSTDLRVAFPEMRGLSQRKLVYMRSFESESWRLRIDGESFTRRWCQVADGPPASP